jgi:hypothetical protein
LRRIVVVATALAVLIGAVSAYAATSGFNSYTAHLKFSPNKAGSAKAPVPGGFTQKYVADGTGGNRTAPLTDIKTKVYGLVYDGKDFPTCSLATIQAAKSDTGCPKGALVATGSITATLGPVTDTSASSPQNAPCNPLLHVWNAGQGKVVYFFVDQGPGHLCAGGAVPTGFVGPFPGTIKTVGKTLVMDTPIPPYVSFPLTGVAGSLTGETLTWKKVTKKLKNGKTVAFGASIGCKNGKRPYSVTFTAENGPGGQVQSGAVTGSQKCTK